MLSFFLTGTPEKMAIVSVVIDVTDINDNAPEFRVVDLKDSVVKENSEIGEIFLLFF